MPEPGGKAMQAPKSDQDKPTEDEVGENTLVTDELQSYLWFW